MMRQPEIVLRPAVIATSRALCDQLKHEFAKEIKAKQLVIGTITHFGRSVYRAGLPFSTVLVVDGMGGTGRECAGAAVGTPGRQSLRTCRGRKPHDRGGPPQT